MIRAKTIHSYTLDSKEELVAFINYLALTGVNIWNWRDSRNINDWNLDMLSFGVHTPDEAESIIQEFNNWYNNNNDNQLRCEGTGGSDSSIPVTMPRPEEGTS